MQCQKSLKGQPGVFLAARQTLPRRTSFVFPGGARPKDKFTAGSEALECTKKNAQEICCRYIREGCEKKEHSRTGLVLSRLPLSTRTGRAFALIDTGHRR